MANTFYMVHCLQFCYEYCKFDRWNWFHWCCIALFTHHWQHGIYSDFSPPGALWWDIIQWVYCRMDPFHHRESALDEAIFAIVQMFIHQVNGMSRSCFHYGGNYFVWLLSVILGQWNFSWLGSNHASSVNAVPLLMADTWLPILFLCQCYDLVKCWIYYEVIWSNLHQCCVNLIFWLSLQAFLIWKGY